MKQIALHSVPRSGSSWIGQILNSSPIVNYKFQPLFSYEFKDYLDKNSTKDRINNFFNKIARNNSDFLIQKEKVDSGFYPVFKKNKRYTHIVYKEVRYHHIVKNMLDKTDNNLLLIGIVRNPFAVINSFLLAPREFRNDLGWDKYKEWQYADSKNQGKKEEFFGFEKWKEIYFLFDDLKKIYANRFFLIDYDKILFDTVKEVKKLFKFCGIKYSTQTDDFINKSRLINSKDVYSVYKIKYIDGGRCKDRLFLPFRI